MSRPLQGTKRQTATGWEAALPVERGSTKRVRWVFLTEDAAQRWLDVAKSDIQHGRSLTQPSPVDLAPTKGRKATPTGTAFRDMATQWADERYLKIQSGGPSREVTVRSHIRRISDWMEERNLSIETMRRDQVAAFQEELTRRPAARETLSLVPAGLDRESSITLNAALQHPEMTASKSTLKRRIKDGALSPSNTDDGAYVYRVADLFSDAVLKASEGGLRPGPGRGGSLAQDVVADIRWVLEEAFKFARDHDVKVPDDRSSLAVHRSDAASQARRRPVSLTVTAHLAAQMHAVHQAALWLQRIMGLRISEAYGIEVGDLTDNGPGAHGVVVIKSQGGRAFQARDVSTGESSTHDRLDTLKTATSYRVLVVPAALMDMLRTVIEVFHTAEDGTAIAGARLIPSLSKEDGGGQSAFRSALKTAVQAAGLNLDSLDDDLDAAFSCTPHDMRRSVISDLNTDRKVKESHARRFGGHSAGVDVHARHYVLDDPELKPMRRIARLLQAEIVKDVPGGLLVPTSKRCTTGNQRNLVHAAARIDAVLEEAGWLVTAASADGDPLLTAEEVAAELAVTPKTARKWMKEGVVPSTEWAPRARGFERRARRSDVLVVRHELRDHDTIHGLALEADVPYHSVYQFIHAQNFGLQQVGERGYVVDPAVADSIRAHYRQQKALHARAVPHSVAATRLDVTVAVVDSMVQKGQLIADEPSHDGRKMVTRESVDALHQTRSIPHQGGREVDLMAWSEARTLLGLTDAEVNSLVAEGALEQVQHARRRHLVKSSVLVYVATNAPERLRIVAG